MTETRSAIVRSISMFNYKIDKCPMCGFVFTDEDVEFEETASYIPDSMWQVCPQHGRMSEFKWSPGWRLEPGAPVKLKLFEPKPKVEGFFIKYIEPVFYRFLQKK
uniref:Uncharacterized protein n=1 Tax=Serratia phage Kevin TaxID=3161161 RepID=A0AAU8L063_9CAUD